MGGWFIYDFPSNVYPVLNEVIVQGLMQNGLGEGVEVGGGLELEFFKLEIYYLGNILSMKKCGGIIGTLL